MILQYDDSAEPEPEPKPGQFTKRLISIMKVVMRTQRPKKEFSYAEKTLEMLEEMVTLDKCKKTVKDKSIEYETDICYYIYDEENGLLVIDKLALEKMDLS